MGLPIAINADSEIEENLGRIDETKAAVWAWLTRMDSPWNAEGIKKTVTPLPKIY